MILLGFYLGHDSNIAVSINGNIKYRKAERYYQQKHLKIGFDFVLQTLKDWNIDKVDYCAFTDGNRQNLGICKKDELYCKSNLSFFESFCLDHHYAHSLSAWPIIDSNKIDYSVSLDGRGDWNRNLMIIKNPASNPVVLKTNDAIGMGFEFYLMGKMLGFKGMEYDFAGKLMGLQAYSDQEIQNFGLSLLQNLDYKKHLIASSHVNYSNYNEWHEYWYSYVRELFDFTPDSIICYNGGCAQNSVYNYRLKKEFPNLIIPPHAYDGGLSLGCLEFLRIKFNLPLFEKLGFPYWQDDLVETTPSQKTIGKVAEILAKKKIVGWVQNQGELGPRALGHRSILMNATNKENKDIINSRIKKREAWRPYAASVMQEFSDIYFDMNKSEYMLYACKVKSKEIPAVTHIDNTCRMQTVEQGFFYDLINQYYKLTGIPLLLNTSLNVMGKPIYSKSNNPKEILQQCNLDALCVGDSIYYQNKL